MSRIIVKNLPKKVTEDDIKKKFSEEGMVTDVQLKYTKDGKFRHFAFVGFQNESEAEAAIHHFNHSYFNSLRITVERCAELGAKNKPKAWSKYAPDSSAYKLLHQSEKTTKPQSKVPEKKIENPIVKELADKLEKFKKDPAFLEYMEIHGKEKELWGNEDVTTFEAFQKKALEEHLDSGVEDDADPVVKPLKNLADDPTLSDADYFKLKAGLKKIDEIHKDNEASVMKDKYFTLVIRGLPYAVKKKNIKDFFKPLKLDSIRLPVKIKGLAYVGFKTEKNMNKALLRNKSFIDGKRIFIAPLKSHVEGNADKNISTVNEKWRSQEESLKMEESIAESGRIFVRNLAYSATEEELQTIFEKFGPVTEVIVPLDKLTRKIKGYALVTYLIPEHAVKAFTELDGTIFHGRMLHLLPGKAKEGEEVCIKEGSSFKTKKMQTLKAEAGSSHNWNTLFLGSNAVADVMAANYNVSKEQILTDNHAAVRLALGETQIVHEIKEFLESSGVKLDAFNNVNNHRSKTVILVKNLPANTKVNEIRELFAKYGVLGRVLVPPNGVTGIVEFVEPAEARIAFKRLAYSKFKNLPLYLEWAPEDTFTGPSKEEPNDENKGTENVYTKKTETKLTQVNDDEELEPETTLFIKNLNFETTEENIKEHFKSCGKIANVTIAKKKDPTKPGSLLSMGYGFIQFYKQRSLDIALKSLQQTTLDGHCIELKRSNRTLKSEAHMDRKMNNVEKQTGCKMLVRNIPFQAKLDELRELFSTFGDIKAIRLPKKIVGSGPHRGFAFVEYYTKEDAKRAMQTLCQSTHLYGRRLVLEWAQSAEDDLEQLRKRTAERFPADKIVRSKKSKADISIEKSDSEEIDEENDAEMYG